MPTEKPKVLLTLEEKLIERVDDYRYDNRIPTRSEAIRRLIEEGLKVSKSPTPPPKKN
jgi:metal-responsive CopG/Arc/MetJ family transcriptional regulator